MSKTLLRQEETKYELNHIMDVNCKDTSGHSSPQQRDDQRDDHHNTTLMDINESQSHYLEAPDQREDRSHHAMDGQLGDENEEESKFLEFDDGYNFVCKIKARFAQQPEIYEAFLEMLNLYISECRKPEQIFTEVSILFKGHPDLIEGFRQFMPKPSLYDR